MLKSPINNIAAPAARLWLLDGDCVAQDDLAFFTRCLGGDETGRLDSIVRPERRRQFILGRILLRIAVSDLTGTPLDAIDVLERRENAPLLVLPDSQQANPNFSLSHSRNWVACFVACGATLGLDIEVHDAGRDIDGIGQMVFHPDQLLWLASRPDAERLSSFYDLWCEREALHKLLCNSGREPDSASIESSRIGSFAWMRHLQLVSGLSVVVVSDRRLFGIQEKILTAFSRADWTNTAQLSSQTKRPAT